MWRIELLKTTVGRSILVLLAISLLGVGWRVSVDQAARVGHDVSGPEATASSLPVLGPVPGLSHWHAAYVVRICDDVLDPFESTEDPLGIHSHSDGVMHIHPFFEEAGYESATLGLFADAMGFEVGEGELTLPGVGTWRDGDLCDGVPGRVFVDRWTDPQPESSPQRIFENPSDIRFEADGELYQIAFAPEDSSPVVPPSTSFLGEVSNLDFEPPEPWVDVDPRSTLEQVSIWPAASVSQGPCNEDQVAERSLDDLSTCFERGQVVLDGVEAVTGARAVTLNRRPAVELEMTPELVNLIRAETLADGPLTLAIEIDGFVVTAAQIGRAPTSDRRLVITGGFSPASALTLAATLTPR